MITGAEDVERHRAIGERVHHGDLPGRDADAGPARDLQVLQRPRPEHAGASVVVPLDVVHERRGQEGYDGLGSVEGEEVEGARQLSAEERGDGGDPISRQPVGGASRPERAHESATKHRQLKRAAGFPDGGARGARRGLAGGALRGLVEPPGDERGDGPLAAAP